jgi:hypothetical protein
MIQANSLVLLNIEEYNTLCHVTDMGDDLREAKAARSERDGSQISRSRRAQGRLAGFFHANVSACHNRTSYSRSHSLIFRLSVRLRSAQHARARGSARGQMQECAAGMFHDGPSLE